MTSHLLIRLLVSHTYSRYVSLQPGILDDFCSQGLNAALFYENKDPRTFVSLVPTSAHTGDGMGSLIYLLVELTQTMLSKRLAHCEELRAQVMEVMINFSVYCFFFFLNGKFLEWRILTTFRFNEHGALYVRLSLCNNVLQVKALPGMGTTIDVILINGRLKEGDTIIVPGVEGPIVTQIRGLLLPPPMKELRVKVC